MKAIRVHEFGGPEVLKFEDVPDPIAGSGQVVIDVRAIGVNPVETYIRAGKYGAKAFPFTPGSDCAGKIASVGSDVKTFRIGQRVYTAGTISGAYAERALCSTRTVFPLPDLASFGQGAALGVPYGTAHRALFHRARAIAGESILIHGASGSVGIAAVQMARALGLIVIGSAGSDAGRQLARDEGAHHVVDHHDPEHLKKVIDLTGGKGVDIIIELASNVNLGNDLPALAKFGRVIVVGSRGSVEINPRDTMVRDADIRGMTLMNVTEAELQGIHAALIAGLENRTLRPVIDLEIPLSHAADAHEKVLEGNSVGKIVLAPATAA